jgi:glycosyltransferase involved in cell wall biosynthesis
MRKCLESLAEQTRKIDEIIAVDDGSTDGMRETLHELRRKGMVDVALCNQVRCGKAAACNLGISLATGDIIINVDADCSYDRDAIEKLLDAFDEPDVGAACGNIGVRNSSESIVASYQAIEYAISISLGKRALDSFNWVSCASGAFSAYRRDALQQVGMNVPGPGEDLDMTMRWDRDALRIRLRKFKDIFTSNRGSFRPIDVLEQIEFVIFNLIVTIIFPIYMAWLLYVFGSDVWILLVAVGLIYVLLDTIAFTLAIFVSRRFDARTIIGLLPYVVTFGVFNGYVMRSVRLWAYFEEWVFRVSYKDSYVPQRVLNIADYH